MTAKPYDVAIFLGRFQPPHDGHLDVLRHGAALADLVIVLIGSSERPRSVKNPFTYAERRDMIAAATARDFTAAGTRLETRPVIDTFYDDAVWAAQVRRLASDAMGPETSESGPLRVCLTGYEKDDSSYYLKLFPEWPYEGAPPTYDSGAVLNATDIRAGLFDSAQGGIGQMRRTPPEVVDYIAALRRAAPQEWARLAADKLEIDAAKARLRAAETAYGGPIRPVHAALVAARGGDTALVTRSESPGRGLLTLPSGPPKSGETLRQAARRLAAEHSLDIGPLSAPVMYDHADRSETGPVVLAAFHAEASGGDSSVLWTPTAAPPRERVFADHAVVLQGMLRRA